MGRKLSEITRFLNYLDSLGEEAFEVAAGQVRDKIRRKKPQVSRRQTKKAGMIPSMIPADSQIAKVI